MNPSHDMGECDIMVLFQFFFLADGMTQIWVIFLGNKDYSGKDINLRHNKFIQKDRETETVIFV